METESSLRLFDIQVQLHVLSPYVTRNQRAVVFHTAIFYPISDTSSGYVLNRYVYRITSRHPDFCASSSGESQRFRGCFCQFTGRLSLPSLHAGCDIATPHCFGSAFLFRSSEAIASEFLARPKPHKMVEGVSSYFTDGITVPLTSVHEDGVG